MSGNIPIEEFSRLFAYIATVTHHFQKVSQLYANYGLLVRNEAVTELQNDEGLRALTNLRETISNTLGLQLLSLWEIPEGSPKMTYSYPSAVTLLSDVENFSNTWCYVDGVLKIGEENQHLSKLVRLSVRITNSVKFDAQRNLRNKSWGHKLQKSRKEIKGHHFSEPIHGDLDRLFVCTMAAQKFLFSAVYNSTEIDWLQSLRKETQYSEKMLENFGVELLPEFRTRTQ
ncbi:MAG: hypothetical protein COA53_12600 [Rhodobacteraceae bacterium]|nr:MAG: hypothetical protein COA53_12600 [Paracoccaceae bacterium]